MQMNENKLPMTQKQKHAAIVCAICALALVVTICVTAVQVMKASAAAGDDASSASSSSSSGSTTGYTGENYIIDADINSAVLTETEDMGDEYLDETLFIGDSNTVRFYNNGLLTTQQFCALEGLTIQSALTEKFVTFKNDDELYTIAQAVAMMKPRRVIITLGTNNADGSMSASSFVASYELLVNAILESYEYTDIIINSIPPITESQTNYPDLSQEVIDEFNMALAAFAEENGYKFLNSAEALKDSTGYGDEDYYVNNDIHLKAAGLNAILNYVTTHAYISDDRRPDTDDIAQRSSSTTTASGTTGSSSSTTTTYTAKYFVDSAGGGTLSSGDETEKSNLSFDIDDTDDSITVTAVPEDGYAFVKWSDGVTTAARTDTSFSQNVNVTAMFGAIGISIEIDEGYTAIEDIKAGSNVEFTATISGGYASNDDIVWYINGEVNSMSIAEKSWMTVASNTDYTIYATVTYNGTTATSTSIVIEQEKTVDVPDVEWLTEAAAIAKLEGMGLKASVTYVETLVDAQIGYVTHQATAEGTEVVQGSTISITVGKQAVTGTMPTFSANTTKSAIESALSSAGFTNYTVTETTSTSVAKGTVISQSYASGSTVTLTEKIEVVLSLGAQTVSVTDVTGMTEANATSTLSALGFTVDSVEAYSATVTAGEVISYSPSGTQNVGTLITLTVSKGPEPTATPEPTASPTPTPDDNASSASSTT